MAGEMIYKIKFDLDGAVKDAADDWEKKYADQLEKALAKRKVKVSLALEAKSLDSLDDIQKRLKALKIEPLTPENRKAIQELTRELKQLANIMEKLSHLRGIELPELQRAKAAKIAKEAEQADEKLALSRERVRQAEERLVLSQKRAATQATATGRAFGQQSAYLERLAKRMIALWSIQQVGTFLTSVREVTAEFELQRVSLGAIIQDQMRANALFSEIKSFALKSPVRILDLTKYTKQLAAYKIGVDELFETTKKLTDVSVGLSVAMDRVVLAYGQTRATGYLRASEIRQFTEMGVPIVEELASKLSKMNGELVTAAQVMEMVSKRAISFEMVKEVFDDMTSAGGMFYNMQEKQGNTLYGMWAKLGDAASVMYDQIGNTSVVNNAMKTTIDLLRDLMLNWRAAAWTIAAVGSIGGAVWVGNLAKNRGASIQEAALAKERQAKNALTLATKQLKVAEHELAFAKKGLTEKTVAEAQAERDAAAATQAKAQADYKAAAAANANTQSQNKLVLGLKSIGKSLLSGLGIGLVITLVTTLIYKLFEAYQNAHRLENALKDIEKESNIEQAKSVRNFESLANTAVQAADGSKKQKDALEELSRTYKDIIPQEQLTIENLRALQGNYESLTNAIKEYVAQQMKQKQINAIVEETSRTMINATGKIKKTLKDVWNPEQITRFMNAYDQAIKEELNQAMADRNINIANYNLNIDRAVGRALESMGALERAQYEAMESADDFANSWGAIAFGAASVYFNDLKRSMNDYTEALKTQITEVEALGEAWDQNYFALGHFSSAYVEAIRQLRENNNNNPFSETTSSYLYKQQQQNLEILRAMIPTLRAIMGEANVTWQEGWANMVDVVDAAQPQILSSIDFGAIRDYIRENAVTLTPEQTKAFDKLQSMYLNLGIPSEVVRYNRQIAIDLADDMEEQLSRLGDGTKSALDNVTKYFMVQGQSVNDYAKFLDDTLKDLRARIAEIEAMGMAMSNESRKKLEDLKNEETFLKDLREAISAAVTTKTKTPADPRIGILKEMVQLAETLNKEYRDMAKLQGVQMANAEVTRIYADTIADAQRTLQRHGLSLPELTVPTNAAQLKAYLSSVQNAMRQLPKSDKEVIELGVKIGKNEFDEAQRDIEKQLKDLSDRIARSKTAQEFYDKILDQTGDVDVAINMTTSVYGTSGGELQQQMADYIRGLFGNVEVDTAIEVGTNNVDYTELENILNRNADLISDGNVKIIRSIIEDGRKANAAQVQQWFKDLKAAEDFADKRVKLARETAKQIAEVEAQARLSGMGEGQKNALISGFREREAKEAAKLEYEAFKETPMYVQMFENLEYASTSALERMKNKLIELRGVWGEALTPTQLKEMQSRLNEINKQLQNRNPFKTLTEAYRDYRAAVKDYTLEGAIASRDEAQRKYDQAVADKGADSKEARAAQKVLGIEEARLKIVRRLNAENLKGNKAVERAAEIASEDVAQKKVELAKALADENSATTDEERKTASQAVEAKKEELRLAERTSELIQQDSNASKTLKENFASAANTVLAGLGAIGDIANGVADIMEAVGADEEDVTFWRTIGDSIGEITAGLQDIVSSLLKGDIMGIITGIITAIPKMFVGFVNIFNAGRIRKANKEIKRQQELLDQLEYSYGRLEKAIEDTFGTAYLRLYRQQLANLQKQQNAYLKQAEAERSKGKKADKEKIKDYENSARDAADAIADMQGTLAEKFLGSDLASAARDFAQAWLEAYKEFGNTADKMSEKFQEMIENMVVESLLARAMQRALEPTFKMIDEMNEEDFNDPEYWKKVMESADKGAKNADASGKIIMQWAKDSFGYDPRDLGSDLTGISRDVASASEESINGLAAGINTQNFYISQQLAEVRLIREAVVNRGDRGAMYTDLMGMQTEHLNQLPVIAANTAATVARCERAAIACEDMAAQLKRVIRPSKEGTPNYVLNAKVFK